MPAIAAAEGVSIESVDAGGQHVAFERRLGQAAGRGPISASLAERMQGSAQEVSAAGRSVTDGGALEQGLVDTAATERQPDALPATVAGADPLAPRRSALGETLGEPAA